MSDFEIDFECGRADYEFHPTPAPEKKDDWWRHGMLVRKGDLKRVRPTAKQLENAVDLLVKCDSAQLPRVAVGIAKAMGGLMPGQNPEPFGIWESMQYALRKMFAGKMETRTTMGNPLSPSDSAQQVGTVGIYLVPGKTGGPKLAIRPMGLMQALELYAARMIATGTSLNTCKHCSTPFLSGGSGQSKKRGDSRFCSDECRWKHHNEMRRKAKSKS